MTSRSEWPLLSANDGGTRRLGIQLAAWRLSDALGDQPLREAYPNDPAAYQAHLDVLWSDRMYSRAMIVMVFFCVFEQPSWCAAIDGLFSYADPVDACGISYEHTDKATLSGLSYFPPAVTIAVELCVLAAVSWKLVLERRLRRYEPENCGAPARGDHGIRLGLLMVCLNILDIVVFLALRPGFRVAFVCRTVYLLLLPPLRDASGRIQAALPEVASVAMFLVGAILLFAWIAFTLLGDRVELVDGEPVNKGFESFLNATQTLFYIGGKHNVFMYYVLPSFTKFRKFAAFWIFFLLVVQVQLLNLAKNVLVAAFLHYSYEGEEDRNAERVEGLSHAFDAICAAAGEVTPQVSRAAMLEVLEELGQSPHFATSTAMSREVMFSYMDENQTGLINKREFLNNIVVVLYRVWVVDRYSQRRCTARLRRSLVSCVESGACDSLVNKLLLFGLPCAALACRLTGFGERGSLFSLVVIVGATTALCLATCAAQLVVYSWGQWCSQRSRVIDFCALLLLACAQVEHILTGADSEEYTMEFTTLVLLFLVLKRLPAVQFMVETNLKVFEASLDVVGLAGLVVFFFAGLGVELWGGRLRAGHASLEGTAYAANKLFALNFNDFPMALNLWTTFLLSEYISELAGAIDAVGTRAGHHHSWVVFALFYVCGVFIALTVALAFMSEVFADLQHGYATLEDHEVGHLEDMRRGFEGEGRVLHLALLGKHARWKRLGRERFEVLPSPDVGGSSDRPSAATQRTTRLFVNVDESRGMRSVPENGPASPGLRPGSDPLSPLSPRSGRGRRGGFER